MRLSDTNDNLLLPRNRNEINIISMALSILQHQLKRAVKTNANGSERKAGKSPLLLWCRSTKPSSTLD